ncbi:MAG TPA: T9SS type A sorting domain-containing protein, partial [Flavobacteriales bacterium]|nr:T9SS type A sorting domain-containing protein [Flavobacteriales bacterium]
YGTGARPIISGSVPVTGWTQFNGNIWRAAMGQVPKYVYADGALMTIARFPNAGWLRVDQGTSTSITDSDLNQASGYWNGATAVIRTTNWSYDTARVSAFANGVLTHSSTGNNLQSYQWGYFLRNKLELLDAAGEWYFDAAAGQLYLWCPANANPNNLLIEATVLDNGISVAWQKHHIRIDGVAMKHQYDAALRLSGSTQLEAMNCTMSDTWQAVRSTGSQQNLHNLTIARTYGTAIYMLDNGTTLENNTLTDIGLQPGLGENNWGYLGIRCSGGNMVVRGNTLTNIGYTAIQTDQNTLIEINVITHPLAILNDGGGIAMDNADGMIIRHNIVRDLTGEFASSATNYASSIPICHGIYFGNVSIKNTLVENNTVSNSLASGIHVDHTMVSAGIRIVNNVLFNNAVQLSISDYSNYNGPGATAPYHLNAYDDVYTGNVMYSLKKEQVCMLQYHVYASTWVDFGTFTTNKYFSPYNDRSIHLMNVFNNTERYYALERWQTERNEDAGSTHSPLYLPDMDVTQTFGTNPVPNNTFNSDVSGWSGWPTEGQITHNTTRLDGGAAKVNFSNNSTYNTFKLKHNALVPVQSGEWYQLSFSVVGDVMGELLVGFKGQTQLAGPQMEGSRYIPFDGNRRDVTLFFQSTISDQGYCTFTNSYTESTYYIDNVELLHVAATPVDPFLKQQLFVNDQATTQTFDLVGCWSDVNGVIYSGSIDVAPFSSLVLVKEATDNCISTGTEDSANAHISSAMLYPNPAAAGSTVTFVKGSSGATALRIFDMQGKLVHTERVPVGSSNIVLPASIGSGTYQILLDRGDAIEQQRLVVL